MILWQLFWSFLQVGLFSIGGGHAAIPLIQNQVVESHGWLTMSAFSDLITIAEMTPGPISINSATFVGIRVAGLAGALTATLAFILPSFFFVTLLAWLYEKYHQARGLEEVFHSLRPAVVALIASAGLKILRNALFSLHSVSLATINPISFLLFAAAFFLLRRYKWNPILAMLLCGGAAVALYSLTGLTP